MSQLILALARQNAEKRKGKTSYDDIFRNIRILNKQNELVPFMPNRAQAHLMQNLTGRDIVLKARQLGFSTLIRALHETKGMTETARLATLAHDLPTTAMLRRMSKRMWEYLPDDIRPPRGMDNATTTIYDNTKSEVIIRTAGSSAGGRGGTLSDVHGSEVAFWKHANDNMAGIMQAVPMDGNIVLESTPNGASGWFYETCMEALDNNSIWTLHFYEWWWNDEYRLPLGDSETLIYTSEEKELADSHNLSPEQIKWRRYKKKELPHTFLQEYPEDVHSCFLASGNSFFGDVSNMFTAPLDAKPIDNHRYVAGLDFGQSNDFTVLIVIDTHTLEQVDMVRVNRMEQHLIRERLKPTIDKWNCRVLGEENSLGRGNIEAFRQDGYNVVPFNTNARTKPMLIQGLYAGLHESGLKLQNHPELAHELRNFISKQTPSGNWQYEGANGSHDDCVIALALAWMLAVRGNITIQAI